MAVEFWGGAGNHGQFAGTGDWSTASNWIPSQVPASGDLAIDQGGYIVATNVGIVDTTVWLYANEYVPAGLTLDGSSLGPGSLLLTNADNSLTGIALKNSALEGSIFAGSGATSMGVDPNSSAVNYGWIGIADNTGDASISLEDHGSFGNSGGIEAGVNGTFSLAFGGDPDTTQYVWNTGYMTADPGGRVALYSNGETASGTAYTGTLLNTGSVNANGGSVEIDANVVQAPNASIDVTNGGSLTLSGAVDDGTIQITSGMLSFRGNWTGPGPFASAHFDSTLAFTGSSATLDFGETVSAIDFLPSLNRLEVAFPWEGNYAYDAYLNLSGSYTASDFTVSGHQVIYTAHPTS